MKIAICGTHCSGKSTLVDYISDKLNLEKIKEVAGKFPEEKRKLLTIQLQILQSQINEELSRKNFISDRSVIDNCAYLHFHAKRLGIDFFHDKIKSHIKNYLSINPYDLIIFVDEYFPLEDNGIRNLDVNQQKYIFDYLKQNIFSVSKKFNIDLICVKGTTEDRYEMVSQWLTSQTRL